MNPAAAPALAAAQETERQLGTIPLADDGVTAAVTAALAAAKDATARVALIPPPRPVEKTVQSFGAKVNDPGFLNNAAFAKAVASKSVIIDTPGTYWLDGVLNPFDVNVGGCKVLVKAPNVVLRIRPNNQSRYYVMRVTGSDCEVDLADALIMGDRDQHTWVKETDPMKKWHEHGYGLWVSGARNRVRGLFDDGEGQYGRSRITNCTGDGIGIKGPGHEIAGFVSDRNRRQGLSAFDCADNRIHHCSFTNTGPYPGVPDPLGLANPFAGIDVEPDKGNATGLKIYSNLIRRNRKSGLVGWVRAEVSAILELEAWDNRIEGNTNGCHFKDAKLTRVDTVVANLHHNLFVDNSAHDTRVDYGAKVAMNDNTFDRAGERADVATSGIISPEMGRYGNGKLAAGKNARI